jgi:hydroxyethylthiazole kinase-like uncharacterized protein yjeF
MSSLPLSIHTAAQVRELDRYAIESLGIPGYTLMTRAGAAALTVMQQTWPTARRVLIVCGPGNNGGDGYVLARLARAGGFDVSVVTIADVSRLKGDARRAYDDFAASGGIAEAWEEGVLDRAEIVVDAMFGTGLERRLDAAVTSIIEAINARARAVLALDVPSGLHSDTGAVLGVAVRAHRTVTFIGLKLGFYLGAGPDHIGVLAYDDLQVPRDAMTRVPAAAVRIAVEDIARALPPRARTAHKGLNGDVLIVGGGIGMAGAARLAGEAALRSGAGRVTVATRPENVSAIVAARPELMCRGVESAADLEALIARADVLAVGPGLGQDAWSREMFEVAIQSELRAVFDADALNLLALRGDAVLPKGRRVLTPHPGEASRLLSSTSQRVQSERLAVARELAERFHSIVVLKGAASIVAVHDAVPAICDRGNPGMASPGMGDVLTGVIAGVIAQAHDFAGAVRAGVLAHAMAGDLAAAKHGERGLIASDLFEYLPSCLNQPLLA